MIMIKRFIVPAFILAIAVSSCTPSAKYLRDKGVPSGYENNFVRVLVAIEKGPFRIGSTSGLKVLLKSGGRLLYETKQGKLVFYPDRINEVYVVESDDSVIQVNGHGYRGKIELHNVLGKINIINVVNVEEYLYSVVPSEMPSSWDTEALKAQAVASRTYIYFYLFKNETKTIFDADATTSFQVYKGISSEKKETTEAVDSTRGIIMTYNYEPILAYFHSTSGGKTSDDKYVWKGSDLPYLQSVKCSYGIKSPHNEWELTLSVAEINSLLKNRYSGVGRITGISFKKYDDRVYEVIIKHTNGTITMSGNDFRIMISPVKLKSTLFTSVKKGDRLYIKGRGWGHGVGMCQWGARGRAESGQKYQQILSAYYNGIKFTKIPNNYLAYKKGSGNRVN